MEGEPHVNLNEAEKYERAKELARRRQKAFYDRKKDDILRKKRADRKELKRVRLELEKGILIKAPRVPRGANEPAGRVFSAAEIQAKKNLAKKTKFTYEEVVKQLDGLLGTQNQTTHDVMNETSIKNHKNHMKSVFRITGCADLKECLKHFAKIKQEIDSAHKVAKGQTDEKYSLVSRQHFFQSILFVINNLYVPCTKAHQKQFEDEYERLKIENSEDRAERVNSEEHAVFPYNVLLEKVKEAYPANSKQVLVFEMYNDFMCRNNFKNLLILSHDKDDTAIMADKKDKDNYLVVPRNKGKIKIILTDYKTQRKYGIIRGEFSTHTSDLMRAYMTHNGITAGMYFFNKTAAGLTAFVGTVLKKLGEESKGAINYLRHSKKTEIFQNNNLTAEEKRKAAEAFQHSPLTSLSYIRKAKLI